MPHVVIDPENDRVTTRELYDAEITDQRITFDDAGRSEQDLDDDVADAFVDEYDALLFESDVDETELDDLAELLSGTVGEITDAITSGEHDDQLDELERREDRGDDRQTVHEAVERRRNALESGGDEPDGEGEGEGA